MLDGIINENLYKPGDKIVETKIAKMLNISQAPVREAIKNLEVMGFIQSKPYKGSYVKKITFKEYKEVYTVRIALEKIAIKELIPIITSDKIEKLENIVHKMILSADDILEHTELDNQFHYMIFSFSNNSTLLKMWNQMGIKYWIYKGIIFLDRFDSYNYQDQAKTHQPICNAIKNRNAKEAVDLINDHYKKHLEIIKKNKSKLTD